MKFSGKAMVTLALSLHVGLAWATSAAAFLAQHPDIQVGRDALTRAEASAGPDTFSIVNKPVGSIVLYQAFDAGTNERVSAVALVDDAEAEAYYQTYNRDGDAAGAVMKRYDDAAGRCGRAAGLPPRALFRPASRCGQFCTRSQSCTGDARCRSCRYVGGNCNQLLSCQPR